MEILQQHLVAQRTNGEIQSAIANRRQEGGELRFIHGDARFREHFLELFDHLRQEGEANQRGITKGDIHDGTKTEAVNLAHHVFHFAGDRLRVRQQHLACSSEFHAGVFADHHFHAEVGFDIADDFADGGLRQTQLSCSRTYGATFNDFLKYNKVLCFR